MRCEINWNFVDIFLIAIVWFSELFSGPEQPLIRISLIEHHPPSTIDVRTSQQRSESVYTMLYELIAVVRIPSNTLIGKS
jgi:hypothetical protein